MSVPSSNRLAKMNKDFKGYIQQITRNTQRIFELEKKNDCSCENCDGEKCYDCDTIKQELNGLKSRISKIEENISELLKNNTSSTGSKKSTDNNNNFDNNTQGEYPGMGKGRGNNKSTVSKTSSGTKRGPGRPRKNKN